ncbi:MAG: RHS repeat-associated core domain-containing protein [Chloroflexota bacterium]
MDYKARMYSSYLNHFIQPDTIVPNPANPQTWNRYSYTRNNPVRYSDPTGHDVCDEEGAYCYNQNSKYRGKNRRNPPIAPEKKRRVINFTVSTEGETEDASPASLDEFMRSLIPISNSEACEFIIEDEVMCNADLSFLGDPSDPRSIQAMLDALIAAANVDAAGVRVEGSVTLPIIGGVDLNVDVLYFRRSREFGSFITPGLQRGSGGGGLTFGLVFGNDMPNRGAYAGQSVTVIGADIPLVPLGVNVESDYSFGVQNPNGTTPSTFYIGGGPLQPEVGEYAVGGYAIPLLHFTLP